MRLSAGIGCVGALVKLNAYLFNVWLELDGIDIARAWRHLTSE